jgi:hypothetical protein
MYSAAAWQAFQPDARAAAAAQLHLHERFAGCSG